MFPLVLLSFLPFLRLVTSDSSVVKRYSTLAGSIAPPPLPYALHTTAIFHDAWPESTDTESSWPAVEERIDPIYVPELEYRPVTSQVSVASSQWGVSNDRIDDLNYGPAKYEFGYKIEDSNTWNNYGHREGRLGDLTWGSYEVLLPDGRKQIVDYEADSNGYRPRIRYEVAGVTVGTDHFSK